MVIKYFNVMSSLSRLDRTIQSRMLSGLKNLDSPIKSGNDEPKKKDYIYICGDNRKPETLREKIKQAFILRGVIIALALLVLSGCASMAPEYTRPEAPVPSEWPSGPAYKASTSGTGERSADDITWQEFFIDKQLQTLIALALENNRDLRIAALNIEKTRGLYRIQRAELLPAVNAGATIQQRAGPRNFIGQWKADND